MKKTITAILLALATSFALAQSPTPTPTPAPTAPRITAMVTTNDVVVSGSVTAITSALPATQTTPGGTVCTLRGYTVRVSGTTGYSMISAQYAH